MNPTLDDITLPDDIFWSDETAPWKVGQTVTKTLTGALVIQEGALQAGRPITLQSQQLGRSYVAVVDRATVDALLAKEAVADAAPMTLVWPIDGGGTQTYQVRWRRSDGAAIEAAPISFKAVCSRKARKRSLC